MRTSEEQHHDVAEALVAGLTTAFESPRDILLVSCIGSDGRIGPSEAFLGRGDIDSFMQPFEFATLAGASQVLIVFRLHRLALEVEHAVATAESLEEHGNSLGVGLVAVAIAGAREAWVLTRQANGWSNRPA